MTKTQSWVDTPLSPYRLAQALSEAVGRTIAPQVIYQKTRNGSLSFTLTETGHQSVSASDGNSFIQAFLEAEAAKDAKAAAAAAVEVESTEAA